MVMVCWMAVFLSLLREAYAQTSIWVTNSPPNSSLDTALLQTQDIAELKLELQPSAEPFEVKTEVEIRHQLTVLGRKQTLLLAARVVVRETGCLRLGNVTVISAENGPLQAGFEVHGSLVLSNASIQAFPQSVFRLYGMAALSYVEITGNSSKSVIEAAAPVYLTLVSVSALHLSCSFLSLRTAESPVPFDISISGSRFEDNFLQDSSLFVVAGPGTLRVKASVFNRNRGTLFQASGSALHLDFAHSSFQQNGNSLLTTTQLSNASVSIDNCSFVRNTDISFYIVNFEGTFLFHNSTLRQQLGRGPVYIENSYLSERQCEARFTHSHISDFNITISTHDSGSMLHFVNCASYLSNVTINNATVLSSAHSTTDGLIVSRFSWLSLEHVAITDSGSAGCVILVTVGSLYMSDFTLTNPLSGQGIYVEVVEGSGVIEKGEVAEGGLYHLDVQRLLLEQPIYFLFIIAEVEIRDVAIANSTIDMGIAIALVRSSYTIQNIRIANLFLNSVFTSNKSKGKFADISVERTEGKMHTFQGANGDISVFTNISISNCPLKYPYGVFMYGKSDISISNLTYVDSSSRTLMGFADSRLSMNNVTVERCVLDQVIGLFGCQATIANLHVAHIQGQMFTIMDSNVSIVDTSFIDITSSLPLVDYDNVNLDMASVVLANATLASFVGRVSGGKWQMRKCIFENINASGKEGWEVFQIDLIIENSSFREYDFGMFHCVNSNVTITDSVFSQGHNPVKSLKSRAAYGAALGCANCPLVTIQRSHFRDLSASVGGAVSVTKLQSPQELILAVKDSTFILCRATRAGALFVQNVSFAIESSHFVRNSAELMGGGVHAAIKPWQTGLIRNSTFTQNTASEGGGLKWTNAKVLLENVAFEENTAVYGPDVASYGVSLSPQLTHLTGQEASGYPLTLIFELLDHYGRRVNLSPYKNLILSSTSIVAYRGNNSTILNQGLFSYSGLTIYAPPNSVQVIEAVLNDTQEDYELNIIGQVLIDFRPCVPGEIARSDRCDLCSPGNVSFSLSDEQCSFCPAHAFCAGGNRLSVDFGYWRSAANSTTILKCPFPDKCKGGENSTCAPNFTGQQCNECAPGTSLIRATECVSCDWLEIVQPLIILLILLGWQCTVLRWTVYHPNHNKLYIFKVLISHFQCLSVLCFLRVSYSPALTWTFHIVNSIASLSIPDLPLSCYGVTSPLVGKAIAGSAVFPVLLLLYFLTNRLTTISWKSNIAVLASSTLLYTPFIATVSSFPLLACQSVEASQKRLFFQLEIPCWTADHKKYIYDLVLPSLLLNFCLPLIITVSIRLVKPHVFTVYYPMWISGYHLCLWDLFPLLMKCSLATVVIVSMTNHPLNQVGLSLAVLIVFCTVPVFLHNWVNESPRHFLVAEASLIVVTLSQGFLSFYVFFLPGGGGSEYFVVGMVFLLNIGFLALCGFASLSKWLEQKPSCEVHSSSHGVLSYFISMAPTYQRPRSLSVA